MNAQQIQQQAARVTENVTEHVALRLTARLGAAIAGLLVPWVLAHQVQVTKDIAVLQSDQTHLADEISDKTSDRWTAAEDRETRRIQEARDTRQDVDMARIEGRVDRLDRNIEIIGRSGAR